MTVKKVAKLRYQRFLGMRRNWCESDADQWTREDIVAAAFSFLSYFTAAVGIPLLILQRIEGYVLCAVAVILAILLFFIITPKLNAVSASYEEKQREYIKRIEEEQRWSK